MRERRLQEHYGVMWGRRSRIFVLIRSSCFKNVHRHILFFAYKLRRLCTLLIKVIKYVVDKDSHKEYNTNVNDNQYQQMPE